MSFALISMLESSSIDSTTAPIAEPYEVGPLVFKPLEDRADYTMPSLTIIQPYIHIAVLISVSNHVTKVIVL